FTSMRQHRLPLAGRACPRLDRRSKSRQQLWSAGESPPPCGEVEIASAISGGGLCPYTNPPTRNLLRKFRPLRKGEVVRCRDGDSCSFSTFVPLAELRTDGPLKGESGPRDILWIKPSGQRMTRPSFTQEEVLAFHAGRKPGKIEIRPTKPMATQRDL